MKTKKIGKVTCDYVENEGAGICYIMSPMPLDGSKVSALSVLYGCKIVVVHGMEWNDDFTPWQAPGILPKDADFKGLANEFLSFLRESLMPEMEGVLGVESSAHRTIIGISLSGMFALWAWMQGDDFVNIASISGSFWYDGFVDWFRQTDKCCKKGIAYFSLGDKEAKDSNPRFGKVGACTADVVAILNEAKISAIFELTVGSHFAPVFPRLEKAFKAFENCF